MHTKILEDVKKEMLATSVSKAKSGNEYHRIAQDIALVAIKILQGDQLRAALEIAATIAEFGNMVEESN